MQNVVAQISLDTVIRNADLIAKQALRGSAYGLILTVSSLAAFHVLLRARARSGGGFRVHLAVNTGMNRYGFRPERVRSACRLAVREGVSVEGVFSHYYAPECRADLNRQRAVFSEAAKIVREYFPDCIRHIAATGGVLAGGELFDCVRSGIALYGYLPAGFEGALPVQPAMTAYAAVAQAGTYLGGGAGYGRAKKEYGKLYTLRLGYGDGFFRAGGPGVGKLCMDGCVCEGETRFGRRKAVLIDVSDYARRMNTIEYEVLVSIGNRAVRRYV